MSQKHPKSRYFQKINVTPPSQNSKRSKNDHVFLWKYEKSGFFGKKKLVSLANVSKLPEKVQLQEGDTSRKAAKPENFVIYEKITFANLKSSNLQTFFLLISAKVILIFSTKREPASKAPRLRCHQRGSLWIDFSISRGWDRLSSPDEEYQHILPKNAIGFWGDPTFLYEITLWTFFGAFWFLKTDLAPRLGPCKKIWKIQESLFCDLFLNIFWCILVPENRFSTSIRPGQERIKSACFMDPFLNIFWSILVPENGFSTSIRPEQKGSSILFCDLFSNIFWGILVPENRFSTSIMPGQERFKNLDQRPPFWTLFEAFWFLKTDLAPRCWVNLEYLPNLL